ncbi:hypothetical protein ACHAWC_002036 [Mediolabrus comicus]
MKAISSSTLAFLFSCASVGKSAAATEAHHHPNYLRGIIDDLANNAYGGNNHYDEAYIKLACSNAFPVAYEKCSLVPGCNEQNRAVKQCFALRGATADIYTCAARGACDTTTTTTTTTPPPADGTNDDSEHNTKRQVDGQKCCELEDVGCCRGEKVCFDQTFHGEHIIYCDRVQETKAPPSKQCLHHKQECEPTHAYEKCCDEMTCASVKDKIEEPFQQEFHGREYACLKLTPPTTTPEKETRDVPVGPVCAHQNNECDPDATDGVKHCCGNVPCLSVDQVSERTRSYLPSEFKFVCSARGESDVVEGDFVVDV